MNNFAELFGLKQIIKEPTRVKSTSSSIIDLIFVSDNNKISNQGVLNYSVSDHQITFGIRKKNTGQFKAHNAMYIRCLKNYTIDHFRKQLNNVNWFKVITCDNVDCAWNEFKTLFTNVIDHVAPVKLKRLKQRRESWFDHTILECINERNHALHLLRLIGSSEYYDLYKNLRNKTQLMVKNAKETYYTEQVNEFKNK